MRNRDTRRLFMVSLVLCTGVALAFGAGAVGAQDAPVSKGDAGAIEKVIRAQLDAFAADDAAKAFSFAAPGIRQSFGTPDNFMQMVRMGYPVVYRPAAVVFLKPSAVGREVFQPVQMTDHEGQLWIALYNMQRQPGGNWLTGGCRLLRSDGKVTQAAPQLVPI